MEIDDLRSVSFIAHIEAICDECECYGYGRAGFEPRHDGMVMNSKQVRRSMHRRRL